MPGDVLHRLRTVTALDGLPEVAFARLAETVQVRRLARGETLVEAGEDSDEVYLVVSGALEVLDDAGTAEPTVLATLEAGDLAGELAALVGTRRTATLRAARAGEVLVLGAATFRAVVDDAPAVAARLADEARRRLQESQLARHLRRLFPEADVGAVLGDDLEWVDLDAGAALFRQGDPADAAYVVVSGRLRVFDEQGGEGLEPVAEVGAGELVGEMALLDASARGATVVAARQTVLASLPCARFEELVLQHPKITLALTRTILARTRDPMDPYQRARAGDTTIALVPLTHTVDIAKLAAALQERMARFGPTAHVGSERIGQLLCAPEDSQIEAAGPAELRLSQRLREVEDEHRIVLYECDGEPSAWSRRCVARSDHLVLVADAAAAPEPTAFELELVERHATLPHKRVSLVLLHDDRNVTPGSTAPWLTARRVDQHHHVQRGADDDLDRLARHLAGRAVGLVLSGGGARGFAHLGVVRALHELGVPIDMLAGASVGATLAALVALPTPLDDLVPVTARAFTDVIDYTLPAASLAKGKRVAEVIAEGTGGRDLEDFWLPYLCTSTNLTDARVEVHTRGAAVPAIRASLAIPGVFPPVPRGEHLLVDGGVLNNLPVDVVRRRAPSATLIAVDVAPPRGPRAKADYGVSVSGAEVLAKRLLPGLRPPAVPGLTATLMRALITGAIARRNEGVEAGIADLYLSLDLRGVGMLDFDKVAPVADRGYEAARPEIAAWLADDAAPSNPAEGAPLSS